MSFLEITTKSGIVAFATYRVTRRKTACDCAENIAIRTGSFRGDILNGAPTVSARLSRARKIARRDDGLMPRIPATTLRIVSSIKKHCHSDVTVFDDRRRA